MNEVLQYVVYKGCIYKLIQDLARVFLNLRGFKGLGPRVLGLQGLQISPADGSRNLGLSEKSGVPCFRVLIIRILLFRVLYEGPLFSETFLFGSCIHRACFPFGGMLQRAWPADTAEGHIRHIRKIRSGWVQ